MDAPMTDSQKDIWQDLGKGLGKDRQKHSQVQTPPKQSKAHSESWMLGKVYGRLKGHPEESPFTQALMASLKRFKAELTGWHLEDYQCLLCQSSLSQPTRVSFLCQHCVNALPRASHSCSQCAEPLAATGNSIKRIGDHQQHIRPVASTPMSLCKACQTKSPDFDATFYSYLYTRPIDHWISQVKDRHQVSWLLKLCRLMREHTPDISALGIEAVSYIPSTPFRTVKRGMNPGEEFARYQAQQLGLPVLNDILQKTKSVELKHLSARDRQAVSQSSLSIEKIDLEGRHLLLVDDVMTTGETANTAARLLKSRGAARVYVWVLARTPAPGYLTELEG